MFGGAATASFATASSSLSTWHTNAARCYIHQAVSDNTSSLRNGKGTNISQANVIITGCTSSHSSVHHIGVAAFLKKTNGSACSTAGAAYEYTAAITRSALYNSSACGTGVSLQGTATSYGYNYAGTGYLSSSIAAPFQSF